MADESVIRPTWLELARTAREKRLEKAAALLLQRPGLSRGERR
ncbi:MAG TPA: hypothetical protein VLF16_01650 [Pseudomonas sp.]|nr:hypothetical protein [Pseudomonas sp.]